MRCGCSPLGNTHCCTCNIVVNINIVNIGTPKITAVIILKFEQGGFSMYNTVHPKDIRKTNSVDHDCTVCTGLAVKMFFRIFTAEQVYFVSVHVTVQ